MTGLRRGRTQAARRNPGATGALASVMATVADKKPSTWRGFVNPSRTEPYDSL